MVLEQYTYVFAIGTFFALMDAYNNGASKSFSPSSCLPARVTLADTILRRCCQRLGYQCVVEIDLVQTSHDIRYYL